MDQFYIKYLKYKNKYLNLKKTINQEGGAGFPVRFTDGKDSFTISGYSQLYRLNSILKKKEEPSWLKVTLKLKKIIETESYDDKYANTISLSSYDYKYLKNLASNLRFL